MDTLGFGLENYDAKGRGGGGTNEGMLPVDATGRLPDGRNFFRS